MITCCIARRADHPPLINKPICMHGMIIPSNWNFEIHRRTENHAIIQINTCRDIIIKTPIRSMPSISRNLLENNGSARHEAINPDKGIVNNQSAQISISVASPSYPNNFNNIRYMAKIKILLHRFNRRWRPATIAHKLKMRSCYHE